MQNLVKFHKKFKKLDPEYIRDDVKYLIRGFFGFMIFLKGILLYV